MMIREQLELRETEILSPYASFSRESRGREREEEECDIRPVFQCAFSILASAHST